VAKYKVKSILFEGSNVVEIILDLFEFEDVEVILPVKRTLGLVMPKADQSV
jgi:hypothetical protein